MLFSLALDIYGNIYSCENNNHCKLGLGDKILIQINLQKPIFYINFFLI